MQLRPEMKAVLLNLRSLNLEWKKYAQRDTFMALSIQDLIWFCHVFISGKIYTCGINQVSLEGLVKLSIMLLQSNIANITSPVPEGV